MYRTESTKRNSGAVLVGEWAWSVKEIEDELKTEYRPTTADLHQRLENGSAAAQTASTPAHLSETTPAHLRPRALVAAWP